MLFDLTFIVTGLQNARRLKAENLATKLEAKGKQCYICPCPKDALNKAMLLEDEFDMVLCVGSLYLIGELRGLITNDE